MKNTQITFPLITQPKINIFQFFFFLKVSTCQALSNGGLKLLLALSVTEISRKTYRHWLKLG